MNAISRVDPHNEIRTPFSCVSLRRASRLIRHVFLLKYYLQGFPEDLLQGCLEGLLEDLPDGYDIDPAWLILRD